MGTEWLAGHRSLKVVSTETVRKDDLPAVFQEPLTVNRHFLPLAGTLAQSLDLVESDVSMEQLRVPTIAPHKL